MSTPAIDPWLLEHLACPAHQQPLQHDGHELRCPEGDVYPVVDGIPIMLRSDVPQTLWVADESLAMVKAYRDGQLPIAEPLGTADPVDPEVQRLVPHTNGFLYLPLVNRLTRYPIPDLRLEPGEGRRLLDLGCGWGRWSISAARRGYEAVGIDPSLRHVLAARRVSKQLGVRATFLVADARYAPFARSTFDVAFSYSVIQHLSKQDARSVVERVSQMLKPSGFCFIQMPNTFGLRCLYQQAKRRFRAPRDFEVRYWTPKELVRTFEGIIGETELSVDGFLGLGIQPSDIDMLPTAYRAVVRCSEALRQATDKAPWLLNVADSIYVTARRHSAVRDANGSTRSVRAVAG